MRIAALVPRIAGRVNRLVSDTRYHVNRAYFTARRAAATGEAARILTTLETDGACASTLERLGVGLWRELLAESRTLFAELPPHHPTPADAKSYVIHESPADLLRHPTIVRWGLEEPLLNIVEAYLGLPCAYRGATARRDLADGRIVETRLWHRDDEDRRICKIILYVEDVDENGGGFEYIPRSAMPERFRPFRRVEENEMEANVPRERWARVAGPAGTVIFGDTCAIWHRGSLPVSSDRFTVFFAYNSRQPRHPQYCTSVVPTALKQRLLTEINDRQRITLLAAP
ncbi:MAG: hypothetical protein EXQ91_00255 [Alphaproteobacteria bacterium]|nr:hypothetical protein [Alphaproteobacteria bacterium]